MKKTKLFGLTTLLLSLGLTACLGTGNNGGTGNKNNQEEDVDDSELTWAGGAETHYKTDKSGNRKSEPEPHSWVEYEGDDKHIVKKATCSLPGIGYKKCSVCGKILETTLNKLNHQYEDVAGEDGATCERPGKIHKVCKLCGDEVEEDGVAALGHDLEEVSTGKEGVAKFACKRENCDHVEYVLDVSKATGWNKATTKMNGKSSPDNMSTWDVAGVIADGTYKIQVEGLMSYTSHGDRYWYNMYETDTASSPDKSTEDPFRYFFKVNDATINPDVLDKTWADLGFTGENDSGTPVYGDIVNTAVINGANTFSLCHGNIGFSLIISKVKLIKIA